MIARTLVLLAGTLLLISTAIAQKPTTASKEKTDMATLVKGGNEFTVDLYARLASKDGNLFFSPSSIRTALAMTYAGAAGKTADEMAKTLHFDLAGDKLHQAMAALITELNNPPKVQDFDGKTAPAYQLVIANALWGQKGYEFKKAFLDLTKKDYGAGLQELDFAQSEQARKTINDWVAQQTKDKIKDLIPAGVLNNMTRLVITNAVYFKSNWAEKFQKEATADGPFSLAANTIAIVPMMHQTEHMGYMETDDFQALDMPYKEDVLSMAIFLPKKVDGLAAFEKTLTADNLAKWLGQIKNQSVRVTLPKFKFADGFGVKDYLTAMGMKDAFDANKADFSGMTAKDKLFISAVIHKAFVAVDEEGTEAAAATAVAAAAMAMRGQPVKFTADHPFVFVIRHKASGEILFIGRLVNPKE